MSTVRISLADDHPVVLEGLVAILARDGGHEVVARDLDGDSALRTIREKAPDVAVLDAVMPGLSGVEILETVRGEGIPTRIVLLAGEIGADDLGRSIRLGVDGILLKDEAAQVLIDCVRSVANGGRWVSLQLVERALNLAGGSGGSDLTAREGEVADHVAAGLQNKEIAEKLGIANGTVRIHLHNVFKKLGIQNRVELANRMHDDRTRPST